MARRWLHLDTGAATETSGLTILNKRRGTPTSTVRTRQFLNNAVYRPQAGKESVCDSTAGSTSAPCYRAAEEVRRGEKQTSYTTQSAGKPAACIAYAAAACIYQSEANITYLTYPHLRCGVSTFSTPMDIAYKVPQLPP